MKQTLFDAFHRHGLRGDGDKLGKIHVLVGQFHDPVRQGGRKQHGLSFFIRGKIAQDVLHVLGKPEVQQAISLIDHQGLDLIGFKYFLLVVVDDAPGGTNHDINTTAQLIGLLLVIDTANHLGQNQVGMATKHPGFFIDLPGQFPGRRHDERRGQSTSFLGPGQQTSQHGD